MTAMASPETTVSWELCLYVVGGTVRSATAIVNLRNLCDEYLPQAAVEVVDLLNDPERAQTDDILVVPTLVRRSPRPQQQLIGDLSDTPRVLAALRSGTFTGAAE